MDLRQPDDAEARAHSAGDGAADGVDESLIRWMLSLTPTERLQAAQDMANTAWELRNGTETH